MTLTLTFSAIDWPEVDSLIKYTNVDTNVLVCRAVSLLGVSTTLDEMKIDMKSALLAIGNASADSVAALGGDKNNEKLHVLAWIEFGLNVVKPALWNSNNNFDELVLEPLHEALAASTFIAGTHKPSLADWFVASLLAPRLRLMIPSLVQKYYRVFRWTAHINALSQVTQSSKNQISQKSTFEMSKMLAALSEVSAEKIPAFKKESSAAENVAKPGKNKPTKTSDNSVTADPSSLHPLARVDLRVGRIMKVEKHPAAERLYIETVDLGEDTPRTVVSGLVEHVPLERLQDSLAVFVCNLKPATLCKTVSSAMLLVSKSEDSGLLDPLTVSVDAVPGDRISIDGVIPQPDPVIKPKDSTWEDVRKLLTTINGTACYENKPLCIVGNPKSLVTNIKVPNGIIS